MTDFVSYVILGIPTGLVFALVAIGLVLTYKTSGVFNLAFGAEAYFAAVVYYDLHVRDTWPIIPALLLTLVLSGAVGYLLDRLIFRHQRRAPPIARLVSALGLLVAGPELVRIFLQGTGQTLGIKGIWWDDYAYYHFGDYVLDGRQMAIIVSVAVSVVLLGALFRWSAIGLQMRAVVESARMTELSGINADRVGAFAWILSSVFAGLAGVLLAPYSSVLNSLDFLTLLVAAIAAAAFGRLRSIPMTLAGGVVLGVVQALLKNYLPQTSVLARNLEPALPFLALFLLLVFLPSLRRGRELTDPLAGVEPPAPGLAAAERHPVFTVLTRVLTVVVVGVVVLLMYTAFDTYWLHLLTDGVIYAVIFLSITVITGMAGQISLCQAAFAAIGAFGTGQLVHALGFPVLGAIVVGALMAAAVGALLAVPALRLGGIFLSLATLAFGLMFENVVVPLGWVSGGTRRLDVPRPLLGPFDLTDDKLYFLFCVAVLALMGVAVILVRRGTTGHFLDAVRGSEVAAESIGINLARVRVVAFALSAGIAGLGGGLLATRIGIAQPSDYSFILSLLWVAVVVSLSPRTVEGAIYAGVFLVLTPEIFNQLGVSSGWTLILFGLGALQYARHPEGVQEHQKRRALQFFERLFFGERSGGEGGRGPGRTGRRARVVAVPSDVREPARAGAEP